MGGNNIRNFSRYQKQQIKMILTHYFLYFSVNQNNKKIINSYLALLNGLFISLINYLS